MLEIFPFHVFKAIGFRVLQHHGIARSPTFGATRLFWWLFPIVRLSLLAMGISPAVLSPLTCLAFPLAWFNWHCKLWQLHFKISLYPCFYHSFIHFSYFCFHAGLWSVHSCYLLFACEYANSDDLMSATLLCIQYSIYLNHYNLNSNLDFSGYPELVMHITTYNKSTISCKSLILSLFLYYFFRHYLPLLSSWINYSKSLSIRKAQVTGKILTCDFFSLCR